MGDFRDDDDTEAARAAMPPSTASYPLVLELPGGRAPDHVVALVAAARTVPNLALIVVHTEGDLLQLDRTRRLLASLGRQDVAVVAAADRTTVPEIESKTGLAVMARFSGVKTRWLCSGSLRHLEESLNSIPGLSENLLVTITSDKENHSYSADLVARFHEVNRIDVSTITTDAAFDIESDAIQRLLEAAGAGWERELRVTFEDWFRIRARSHQVAGAALSAALQLPFVTFTRRAFSPESSDPIEDARYFESTSVRGGALLRWLSKSIDPGAARSTFVE